jgi:hypothetical protein
MQRSLHGSSARGIAATSLAVAWTRSSSRSKCAVTNVPAAAGTPVVAVEDGTIAQLVVSVAGGITVCQFDPTKTSERAGTPAERRISNDG